MRATWGGDRRADGRLAWASGLLIALLLLPFVPEPASASDLERQRNEAEQKLEGVEEDLEDANNELSEIERRHAESSEELEAIEARIAEIEARIAALQAELAEAKEELAAAEQALADTEAQLADTEDDLDGTRHELSGQQDLFGERVRGAFKRSNVAMAGAVLEAQDLQQATRAAHYVKSFMERDVEQIETIVALESRIEQAVARLGELQEKRDAERQAAQDERDRIAGLVAEQEELQAEADAEAEQKRTVLAQLEADEERYEQMVASMEADSQQLKEELAEISAEEERRAEEARRKREAERRAQEEAERRAQQEKEEEERRRAAAASRSSSSGSSSSSSGSSSGSSGSSSSSSSASSSSSSSSELLRPMPSRFRVTSSFGYRTHPIHGTRRLHSGMDFGSSWGTNEPINGRPIRAAESGTVVSAGGRGGYGLAVVINHGGGMSTLYAHQSRLAVSAGQSVSRGQTIGYVGTTGTSTAPHLHFEVLINGSPVNPAPYL